MVDGCKQTFKVLSPTAILGYGFPEKSFEKGMSQRPDLIAVDAGSTDPGPYYLGAGKSFTTRPAVKRDLGIILKAAIETSIPAIIGTAGGCGAKVHVDWTTEIIAEIAREKDYSFRMAVIYADISKDYLINALQRNLIQPLGPVPAITPEEIKQSERIVAQMGVEPVLKALEMNCRIIVCGRCYDPVPFAAPAIKRGFDPGLAYHMGKILECAAIAATPGSGRDCVIGTLYKNRFELEALDARRRFTRISTAAHTLYEKSDPYTLPGPGGSLDLTDTSFKALDNQRVSVSGTRFVPADHYTVKLEGAKPIGFRTISIAGIRDPILIKQIDSVLYEVKKQVMAELCSNGRLFFHVYGKDGVMGAIEPEKQPRSHELGLVIEVIAADQQEADAICGYARSTLLHYGYRGRISTAGNLALLYSPSDISCGKVYTFNIYHLLTVEDPTELFPIQVTEVGL